jgi:Uma2 family endonuclease
MALHERSVRLTYHDYLLFPEDGRRHEILDGEHYVTAAPYIRHQIVQQRLNFALSLVVEPAGLGQILSPPVDVLLSPNDIVQPDLLFIAKDRLGILTERNVQGAPDLVVEILSGSSRRIDREVKRGIYERYGVREYWLVDTNRDTVTVYCSEGEGFGRPTLLSAKAGSRLTSPLFPNLDAGLAELFA